MPRQPITARMFPVMLNFHRECLNPVTKHSRALVFFAVSKQIPIVYSADRGRAEKRVIALISANIVPHWDIYGARVIRYPNGTIFTDSNAITLQSYIISLFVTHSKHNMMR